MPDDQPLAWERQPGEPDRAFHAFTHFRDLGPHRSVDRAWRAHKRGCEGIQIGDNKRAPNSWSMHWTTRWGWGERARLWDQEVDRLTRERTAHEHREIRLRQARTAQGAMTVLTLPVRAVMQALQQEPALITNLVTLAKANPTALLQAVALVARVAGPLVDLAQWELGALGIPVAPVDTDRPDAAVQDRLTARITSDPEATELAIALLDRIANDDVPQPTH